MRWFREITPLFAAALEKKREIVNYLLEKGAKRSISVKSNFTYRFYGYYDYITPLQAAFFLDETIFDEFVSDDQIDVIRMLVASGADLSGLYSEGVPIWMTGWRFPDHFEGTCPGWCNTCY